METPITVSPVAWNRLHLGKGKMQEGLDSVCAMLGGRILKGWGKNHIKYNKVVAPPLCLCVRKGNDGDRYLLKDEYIAHLLPDGKPQSVSLVCAMFSTVSFHFFHP